MKRETRSRMFLGMAMVLAAASASAYGQDSSELVGKQVMVVRWQAELKTGSDVVGRAVLGDILRVDRVNGAWLWIASRDGWIPRSVVVPRDAAFGHLSALIARSPTADAYAQRATALVALKRYEDAIADFDAALARDPDNVNLLNDRGNLYRQLGRLDQALADFNALISRGVRHPAVYTNRGLVRTAQGELDGALADYNAAVKTDSRFAPAWEAAGTVRQMQGEYEKAAVNFRRAIEADPGLDLAHNNLAWLLATCPDASVRNADEAIAHATKACKLTAFEKAGYLDTLAAALAEAGRFDEAVQRAQQALDKSLESKRDPIAKRIQLYKQHKASHQPDQ